MSDLKLFTIQGRGAEEIPGASVALEKSLQELMERNLDDLLGVRFIASEYSTGAKHRGRIDTLGLDENGSPVIIEYKRSANENVINQGLFYLDWLMDHQAEFRWLVMEKLGKDTADSIEWSGPRLLCIAGDFTRYDEHAVQQMNRNIELIRYRKYGEKLLLLELINAASAQNGGKGTGSSTSAASTYRQIDEILQELTGPLKDLYDQLDQYLVNLGDDVQVKQLKYYVAYKRLRNFACVEVHTQKESLTVYVKVDPDTIELEEGFTRDVREIGHFGTGTLELQIRSAEDLKRAEEFLVRSYEQS